MREATTVREFELNGMGPVHGVTCDDQGRVWFAHAEGDLVCIDPQDGRVLKRLPDMQAMSGTAFDGTHLWQITTEKIVRIDPESGEVVHSIERPLDAHCSGMAWVDGTLWIGDYADRGLLQIDAQTGAVLKRLNSDRLVTGVEWIDGELWHGAWEARESPYGASLRRIDTDTGEVREDLALSGDWGVSGTGVDREGRLWCGGSQKGGLRAVRCSE